MATRLPFSAARRFRPLLRRVWATGRSGKRNRGRLFGEAITLEASDRDTGWASCQLEQRKVLDADFNISGKELTITLDDAAQAISFAPSSSVGNYMVTLSGAASNNFNGTDGSALSGNATDTLTVASSAVIDSILVNTNAAVTSGGFSFGAAGSNQSQDELTISVDGDITVANAVLSSSNLTFDQAGNVVITSDVTVVNSRLLINASGIAGDNHALTLAGAGIATLSVGATNLASLTADSDVALNGTVETNLDQAYNSNVSLVGDTTLEGNAATFSSGVAGGNNSL